MKLVVFDLQNKFEEQNKSYILIIYKTYCNTNGSHESM